MSETEEYLKKLIHLQFCDAHEQEFYRLSCEDRSCIVCCTDLTKQLNDLIAPVTRAWTDPEIKRVVVVPGAIKEDEIEITATIKLKRRKI